MRKRKWKVRLMLANILGGWIAQDPLTVAELVETLPDQARELRDDLTHALDTQYPQPTQPAPTQAAMDLEG